MLPKIVCIVGPTASGKTAVGIAVAKMFDGEVIAADSRTVYRGMDIGTAKPAGKRLTAAGSTSSLSSLFGPPCFEVEGVPHWGFNLVNPDESFTAVDFQKFADERIADILSRDKLPIIVGGTGLYVRALIDRPTFTTVAPNPDMRAVLEKMTTQELLDEIAERDPDALVNLDEDNRVRLIRALEILRVSGKPLAAEQQKEPPRYDALQIGLDVEREALYARIDQRADEMVGRGLVDEVRRLKEQYGCETNAMSGIGYRQICDFFAGKVKLRDAVLRIKYDTHHYAKRQITWFARDERVRWVDNKQDALHLVEQFIS